jgi:Ras homolog gene family, member A
MRRLPHVRPPARKTSQQSQRPSVYASNDEALSDSQTTLVGSITGNETQQPFKDSQVTLVPGPTSQAAPISTSADQPRVMALTGPLSFDVLLFARPYRVIIHPSSSPLFIDPFPPNPSLLILTYAIPSRASLHNLQNYWMPQYHMHYPASNVPVLLLGLQRDLRTAKKVTTTIINADGSTSEREHYDCVMPEEGVQAAREMRLDRYAECSALTGELMWEATQDLTKMAAQTTTGQDYASQMCTVL